jgi:hypothetical protein
MTGDCFILSPMIDLVGFVIGGTKALLFSKFAGILQLVIIDQEIVLLASTQRRLAYLLYPPTSCMKKPTQIIAGTPSLA